MRLCLDGYRKVTAGVAFCFLPAPNVFFLQLFTAASLVFFKSDSPRTQVGLEEAPHARLDPGPLAVVVVVVVVRGLLRPSKDCWEGQGLARDTSCQLQVAMRDAVWFTR